jgi:hypothetical protein
MDENIGINFVSGWKYRNKLVADEFTDRLSIFSIAKSTSKDEISNNDKRMIPKLKNLLFFIFRIYVTNYIK